MMSLPAGLVLSLFIAGEPPPDYTCTTSIFTTRCTCTSEAGCTQVTENNLCDTEPLLCSVEGAQCMCSSSHLTLRTLEPAPATQQ